MRVNKPLETLIKEVEPFQNELTEKWIAYMDKRNIKVSKSDIEMYKFAIILDMVKALGNYLKDNDEVLFPSFYASRKGITIICVVERDGEQYPFRTETIIAGGYNIQVIHLRYLVHTKLGRVTNKYYTKLNEEYKHLTKLDRLKTEKDYLLKNIELAKDNLEIAKENNKLSDEQVENIYRKQNPEDWKYIDMTWEQIIENGADKNFDYDSSKFYANQRNWAKNKINHWRNSYANVRMYELQLKGQYKDLDKLNAKIKEIEDKNIKPL